MNTHLSDTHMPSALDKVLQEARSDNLDLRHRAIGQMGLLLEKCTIISGTVDSYKNLLDDDLFTLTLNIAEQQFVVNELYSLILSDKMTVGMIWALGKARRDLSIRPLLEILRQKSYDFNEATLWQALIALDNVITISGSVAELQEQNRLIDEYGIVDWLQSRESARDSRVQKMIPWLMAKIRDSKTYKGVE